MSEIWSKTYEVDDGKISSTKQGPTLLHHPIKESLKESCAHGFDRDENRRNKTAGHVVDNSAKSCFALLDAHSSLTVESAHLNGNIKKSPDDMLELLPVTYNQFEDEITHQQGSACEDDVQESVVEDSTRPIGGMSGSWTRRRKRFINKPVSEPNLAFGSVDNASHDVESYPYWGMSESEPQLYRSKGTLTGKGDNSIYLSKNREEGLTRRISMLHSTARKNSEFDDSTGEYGQFTEEYEQFASGNVIESWPCIEKHVCEYLTEPMKAFDIDQPAHKEKRSISFKEAPSKPSIKTEHVSFKTKSAPSRSRPGFNGVKSRVDSFCQATIFRNRANSRPEPVVSRPITLRYIAESAITRTSDGSLTGIIDCQPSERRSSLCDLTREAARNAGDTLNNAFKSVKKMVDTSIFHDEEHNQELSLKEMTIFIKDNEILWNEFRKCLRKNRAITDISVLACLSSFINDNRATIYRLAEDAKKKNEPRGPIKRVITRMSFAKN